MQEKANLEALSDDCFNKLVSYIHELTGITVSHNRSSMLQGRLRKRIIELQISSYENYFTLVKSDRKEQTIFIDLVTTNETQFFRTPRIWNYLEQTFLPAWAKTSLNKTLTVWSAAASSGEEAHSLAIIFQLFKDKHPSFSYKICGTDISQEMIELCKQGIYSGRSIENFKNARPADFARFLKPIENNHYQTTSEIRTRLQFIQHNLFKTFLYPEKFDLVLLRNVLIYFARTDQEIVLGKILPRMATDGTLIIGESESLTHIQTGFKSVEPYVYSNSASNTSSEVA